MSVETRLRALERRQPATSEVLCTRWVLLGAMTEDARRYAERVCERGMTQIVMILEDSHLDFYPQAPCWCGQVHESPL